ncbi:unnamed protein product [Callosobruchus maculatus]|uniref:Uncharacterized protein n=1 Tax=Callosobruchus maculatus TaxID=64391 RepID=A0A653BQ03_CALMS|nr:unnamed protein product [Callosobruchus maculatus]
MFPNYMFIQCSFGFECHIAVFARGHLTSFRKFQNVPTYVF